MIKINFSYTILFAATVAGVGTAADSTPSAVLWRNGSASGVSVTVSTTAQTGLYKAVFTTDAGWAAADFLELYVTATIAGTAGYLAKVWSSTEIGASELDSDSLAAVNAQVVDALSVDTYAELTAPPAATSSLKDKLTWLFMYARNKVTQTATQRKLYRDDGTTVAGTSGTTDDGTTFTKGEDA